MAVTAFGEKIYTRAGTDKLLTYDGDASLEYIVHSDASDATTQVQEILIHTLTNTGETYLGLPRNAPSYKEIGSGWWEVSIPYSQSGKERSEQNEPQPPGGGSLSSFQFTFQGVTQRIRQSIKLTDKTTNGPDTIDKSAPIGFDGERVNGTDIIIPQASFSETHRFEFSEVDEDQKLKWLKLVGKTNDAAFRNAEIGELLITRIAGSQQGSAPWEITFEFLFNENATETFTVYPIGGGAGADEAVDVKGHELLDFGYEGAVVANQKINRLIWVQVHQVYKSGDYSLLGLGT